MSTANISRNRSATTHTVGNNSDLSQPEKLLADPDDDVRVAAANVILRIEERASHH